MTALSIRTFRGNLWVIIGALFAVSLQVLTTIKLGDTSLRISSSDLLLPVLALMLLIKWTRQGVPRPEWRIRYFWFLLGLALAVPYRPDRDRGAADAAPPGAARQPQAHTGIP